MGTMESCFPPNMVQASSLPPSPEPGASVGVGQKRGSTRAPLTGIELFARSTVNPVFGLVIPGPRLRQLLLRIDSQPQQAARY